MKNTIENAQRFFQKNEVYGVDQWSNKERELARIMFEYANSLVKESDSLPFVSDMFSSEKLEKAYNDGVNDEREDTGEFDIDNYR